MLNKPTALKTIKWLVSKELVPYPEALHHMEQLRARVENNSECEYIWLLEHPPLWTAGLSAKPEEVLSTALPVFQTKRGGKMTYHGPGQRVIYVMLDLTRHSNRDVRAFVRLLEEWLILTLSHFELTAHRDKDNIGIWIGEEKIAALGIRLQRWVSSHGLAVNINPDLAHYQGIVPCGIKDKGITSLAALGKEVSVAAFDEALQTSFCRVFQIPSGVLQIQHFDRADRESF